MSEIAINKNAKDFLIYLYDNGASKLNLVETPPGLRLDYLEEMGLIKRLSKIDTVYITEKGLKLVESRDWRRCCTPESLGISLYPFV